MRQWSVEEWLASEELCNELARRADTDELFTSWEWLSSWWRCYGDTLGAKPEVLAFYRDQQLLA